MAEVVWPVLGTIIVVFVVLVLAQHWNRLLRQQARAIRHLSRRVQDLEDMANPEVRRRLSDAAPVPLEQVFTFSMRFGERFWRDTVQLSEDDRKYVHDYGSFLASLKLERWRSHTVATVSEILPARKSAGLQTRTLDYYPEASGGDQALLLWELALARPAGIGLRPPSLELLLRGEALELRVSHSSPEANGNGDSGTAQSGNPSVLLYLPLDPARLGEFHGNDTEPGEAGGGSGSGHLSKSIPQPRLTSASYWHALYSGSVAALGIDWELRLRDLGKKAEWERWHAWQPGAISVSRD